MNARRRCLHALACASYLAGHGVRAQAPADVKRIGVLFEWPSSQPPPAGPPAETVDALRKRGWTVGTNLVFVLRHATQRDQLPARAKELVDAKVDLIIAFSTSAARAAKAATTTIPIAFHVGADPVDSGLVASMSRPGGNLTGTAWGVFDDKLVEVLKQAVPKTKRVVIVEASLSARMKRAVEVLGVEVAPLPVAGLEALDQFFIQLRRLRPDGVVIPNVPSMEIILPRLCEGLLAARMPAIAQSYEFTRVGGMLSYGPMETDFERRVALTDRLLRGANPSDIAVETPQHFRLCVNLTTAKTLGITIPSTVLMLARPEDVIRS